MSVTPKEEPLEPGKERVKVPKKKMPGKKTSPKAYKPKATSDLPKKSASAPKVAEKVDLLKGVVYTLTEVSGSQRVTDKQTHLLELKRSDKVYRYSLYGKPDELEILRHWNAL
jgi:hypothetical protein